MKRPIQIAPIATIATTLLLLLLVTACASSGIPRRVSEPAANIQQLTVRADGSWSIDLRLNNFSSMSMRFDSVRLALSVNGQPAGTLQASPAITIGPEAADVTTTTLVPSSATRIAIADALARGDRIDYTLDGTLTAAPEKGGPRDYKFKRENALSPVPGLAGVLR